jgi:hypothetical protein
MWVAKVPTRAAKPLNAKALRGLLWALVGLVLPLMRAVAV